MTTRIWVLRHGEPEESARGRCYGKLDVGLSAEGISQMRAAATLLEDESLDAIYASPRTRTMESARVVAEVCGPSVIPLEPLSEIDFGDFEGRTYDEIAATHPEKYREWMERPTQVQFPNGESFTAMWERVTGCVLKLLEEHKGRTIALVSHGGVNRIVLAWAMGLPRDKVFHLGQKYAAVNAIQWFDEFAQIELMNA